MRMRRILLAAAAVLLVVLAVSAAALAAGDPDLSWWMIGGGSRVTTGAVSLSGGVGQGITGVVNSGATDLCSGFWCTPLGARVYLPVVLL
jgi:hypothetical protein